MARGLRINMYNPEVLLLVTCIALSTAIRVDFGTNTGPIVPATPTTTKRPQPPFRNPAPVWENQSGDIPNPKPYKYVPPPPSRPKYNQQKPREFNFDRVIPTQDGNTLFTSTVSSRGPQVFPNFGYNYNSVVPTSKYYTKNLDVYYTDKLNKFNGKYNIKTKKYKVYEKVKYVPQVYYSQFIQVPTISLQQQLPLMQTPQPFRMPGNIPIVHTSPATFTISTPKIAYTKDALNGISKNYRTHQTYDYQQNTLSHDSKTKRS